MICPNCGFDNVPGAEDCAECLQDLTHLDRLAPHNRLEEHLEQDDVRTLNPATPVVVRPDETIPAALALMTKHNVGALQVVDEHGKLVGILSERDILMNVAGKEQDYRALPVRDFMTSNPEATSPDEKLVRTLQKMAAGGYRHLPVVERGHPAGMISVRDLLRYVVRFVGDAHK